MPENTTAAKKRRSHGLRDASPSGPDRVVALVFGNFIAQRTSGETRNGILDLCIEAADRDLLKNELIETLNDATYRYDADEGCRRQAARNEAITEYPRLKVQVQTLLAEIENLKAQLERRGSRGSEYGHAD